jgi:hypothetical protein
VDVAPRGAHDNPDLQLNPTGLWANATSLVATCLAGDVVELVTLTLVGAPEQPVPGHLLLAGSFGAPPSSPRFDTI